MRTTTMLTPDEIAHYHAHGFVIPDFQLPLETIEAIRRDHGELIAKHPRFVDYCPTVLAYDTGFLNYARIPAIVDMVEQLIGPDFALWNSSFFAKPAFKGTRTPWHQDGEYWPIRPVATCTAWIAVDDSTTENGCLRVIRGSHKAKKLFKHHLNSGPGLALNQEIDKVEYDERDAVDLVLKAGQISLHDVFLVHGSEPNTSAKPRRGMTLRYMPTSSVFDRELAHQQVAAKNLQAGHADRTLYLMRGVDRSGRNDFRVRL
jgi:ectoine hydroxylase-related dioxygenase (phytanoyl-CoA dioxygenase family)